MAIIVERLNRSGHLLEVYKEESSCLSVGRGLDQSIIVEDPYVDPMHFQVLLDNQSNTLKCVDVGSLNGVYVEPLVGKKIAVHGVATINSGDIVIAGRSRFRICHSQHHVAPALKLTPWHRAVYLLSVWPAVAVLFSIVAALSVFESYLKMPVTESLQRYALESSYVVLAIFAYGGFWASIGRALKGDGRLITQLLLGGVAVILLSAIDYITPWLAYHLPGQQLWVYATKLLVGCVCFLALFYSVQMATRFTTTGAFVAAASAPFAIALNLVITTMENTQDTENVPYQSALVAPSVNIRPSITSDEFIIEAKTIYPSTDNVQSN